MAFSADEPIDPPEIGRHITDGLRAYCSIPEDKENEEDELDLLAEEIESRVEVIPRLENRGETADFVNAFDEVFIQPLLSNLQTSDATQLPEIGTQAHDTYWMYMAEVLDAAYGTSLADDPLYEGPDGWRREDLDLVAVDLPPPMEPVHDWVIEREQATTPCPRCPHLELSSECLAWWEKGDLPLGQGWLGIYHTCPECPATAVGAQRVPRIWDLSEILLDAIEVWRADCVPGTLARKIQLILEVGGVREGILGGHGYVAVE